MVNKAKSRGVPDRTYIAGSKKKMRKKEARAKKNVVMKLQTNPCKSLVLLACHVVVIRSPRCVRQDEKIPLVSKFDSCSKPNAFKPHFPSDCM